MKIHSAFERPRAEEFDPGAPGITQQQFKDDADINTIMRRYNQTGILGSGRPGLRSPQFMDCCTEDFHEMQNRLAAIKETFMALPAAFREKLRNDPAALVDFMADPANEAECIKLGLIDGPSPVAPDPVPDPPAPNPVSPPPGD